MSNEAVFETIEEVNKHISHVEESTCVKYISYRVDKRFNDQGWKPQDHKNRLYWEWKYGKGTPCIPFDGVPFVFIGHKLMGCHRGRAKCGIKKRQELQDQRAKDGKEKRNLLLKTKKVACPAVFTISRIVKFPGFKLEKDTSRLRRVMSISIKQALQTDPASVQWKIQYFLKIPSVTDHKGHPIGKGADQMDDRVKGYIRALVQQGVRKVKEVKNQMVQYVRTELFQDTTPPPLRRFFPTEKTIHAVMAQVIAEEHYSKIDLVNLLTLAENWKAEAPRINFLLRVQSESENLLLCYQTDWQRRLLRQYGKEVCFLDAAYKRTRFPLPLFFLCVRTNVSVAPVGLFVVQSRSAEALGEALGVFRQWNRGWSPAYILTEHCPVEMKAVEAAFTGAQAVFSDHLRERTWTKWLSNRSRAITNQEGIFDMMKAIAGALTREQHQGAVELLQQSPIWLEKRQLFKNWFTNKWLSEEKRWANAVRVDVVNFVSMVNGGLEMQSDFFTHNNMKVHKKDTLSQMLQFLVDDYFPQMHQRYTDLNSQSSGEYSLNPTVPPFLWHRPWSVVALVMDNMSAALQDPDIVVEQASDAADGTFRVKSRAETTAARSYAVSFGSESTWPSCECEVWRDQRLPCEHFCHVFRSEHNWTWEHLCPKYRDHPLLTLHSQTTHTTTEEIEEALNGLMHLSPASPVSLQWDGPEETVPLVQTPQTPQLQLYSIQTQWVAPQASQGLREREELQKEELQRECVAKLKSIMENVSGINDIDHLQELRQKLDVLQAQSEAMLVQKDASVKTVTTSKGKRKRAGVEIIVAMPKRIKVLSRVDVENVQK
ncbi:uncharacterized protein LOC110523283 [Oncorhynchus mykiss]|uniref:uncharacterized protein LOC110523283 n=1 Tax=Oncorhynchus mykiss TaxID=8022 RepID=UPI001878964D|nr:uncharacterized protein LOC110523283 [Oncorhynchus mykiss]